jgi:hypothetical protein
MSIPLTDIPSRPHPLEGLLAEAGVSRTSHIQITGESGLATLLWLLRRGYENVTFVRAHGPTAAGPADVLLVAQTCDGERLADLLESGPHLAPGGVLIVQTPHAHAPRQDVCPRVLDERGFALLWRINGVHRDVNVARRTAIVATAA